MLRKLLCLLGFHKYGVGIDFRIPKVIPKRCVYCSKLESKRESKL